MSSINSINFNNLNILNTATTKNVNTTNSINESIWTAQGKTQKDNGEKQKILEKINSEQTRIATKYTIEQEKKEAQKAEKILSDSSIPGLSSAGAQLYTKIDTLGCELKELISSINEKCNNCTTSSQVEERVKEFEQEIAQKRQEIVTYTQRIQKAVQLDAKFSKFASDPEKAKLLDKIDMNKITSKLLEPASKNNAGTEDIGEINRGSTEEENTGNDDISNIITGIIKYIETGEKDKQIDGYIKGSTDNKQEGDISNNTYPFKNNRLFSLNNKDENKNPFLPDIKEFMNLRD